jgi:hypothetical protein
VRETIAIFAFLTITGHRARRSRASFAGTEHKIEQFYPDTGPLRRKLYVKHLQFFEACASFTELCFMAANRLGKSEGVRAYEMTLHLTGKYPPCGKGRRFIRPISA